MAKGDAATGRLLIYARVLKSRSEREGFSIPAQQELLHSYAVANGFTIAQEFVDVETAKEAGRGSFGRMVVFIASLTRTCRTILVEKHSILTLPQLQRLRHHRRTWGGYSSGEGKRHPSSPNSRSSEKFKCIGIKGADGQELYRQPVRRGKEGPAPEGTRRGCGPMKLPHWATAMSGGQEGNGIIIPDGAYRKRRSDKIVFERYATGRC